MRALRYLVTGIVGIAIAVALFFVLNLFVTATRDTSTGLVERFIRRATCHAYVLNGSVREANGTPIPFAVIEAVYADLRLATRSRGDGTYRLAGNAKTCEEQPETVSVYVSAEGFRPKRRVLDYDDDRLDVVLERAEF